MHRFLAEIARGQPHFGRFVCWPKHRMKRVVATYSYNKLATYPLVPDHSLPFVTFSNGRWCVFNIRPGMDLVKNCPLSNDVKKFRKKEMEYKRVRTHNGDTDLFSWIFLTRIIYETVMPEYLNNSRFLSSNQWIRIALLAFDILLWLNFEYEVWIFIKIYLIKPNSRSNEFLNYYSP